MVPCHEWMQIMGNHVFAKMMVWMRYTEVQIQVCAEFPWGLVLHWNGYGGFCMMGFLLYDIKRAQKLLQVCHSSYVQLCGWPKPSLQILCNIPSTDEAPFVHGNSRRNCYSWTQRFPLHIVRTNFRRTFWRMWRGKLRIELDYLNWLLLWGKYQVLDTAVMSKRTCLLHQDDEWGHTVTEFFESFGRKGMQEGEQEGSSTSPSLPRQITNKTSHVLLVWPDQSLVLNSLGFLI